MKNKSALCELFAEICNSRIIKSSDLGSWAEKKSTISGVGATLYSNRNSVHAATQNVSPTTIEFVFRRVFEKLGVNLPASIPDNWKKISSILHSKSTTLSLSTQNISQRLTELHQLLIDSLGINKNIIIEYHDIDQQISTINSFDSFAQDQRTRWGVSFDILIKTKSGIPFWVDRHLGAGGEIKNENWTCLKKHIESLSNSLEGLSNASSVQEGSYPVIIAAGSSGNLFHEAFGHLCEEAFLRLNKIDLNKLYRKQYYCDFLTIVDDPTQPLLFGSRKVDDSGKESIPTTLLSNGILVGFLIQDKYFSNIYGIKMIPCARRQDYRFKAFGRMSNLIIEPRDNSPESLIGSVANGLYATKVGSGYFDPTKGIFCIYVLEGRKIERGKMTDYLFPFFLEGKLSVLLDSVKAIANDPEPFSIYCESMGSVIPVGSLSPTCLIDPLFARPSKPEELSMHYDLSLIKMKNEG